MSGFEDCRRRVARAKKHRLDFFAHWNSLLNGDGYSFLATFNDDGQTGFMRVIRDTPLVHDLDLGIGEFFYQLRAALDGAVYEAVCRATTTTPPPDADHIYFPITKSCADYKNKRAYFKQLPAEKVAWLRSLQTYCRREVEGTAIESTSRLLYLLDDCARKDRHRCLHVVGAMANSVSGTFTLPVPLELTDYKPVACNLLDNDSVFMTFSFKGYQPGMPETILESRFNVEISVGEIAAAEGEQLAKILGYMEIVVLRAIDKLEA